MADITDPQAIRFVNEQIRPLCEALRALKARTDAATVDWFAGLNAMFPNDASPVVDGREAEGVSRLTGQDINDVMYLFATAIANMPAATVAKPCVRPLSVTLGQ